MEREGGGIFSEDRRASRIVNALISLYPHLSYQLHCRNLAKPLRCCWLKQGIKQFSSLPSDQIAQRLHALLLPQASVNLRCAGHSAPPIRGDCGPAASREQPLRD